jgi:glycosyltransferase involved in cell wall biosynthesis
MTFNDVLWVPTPPELGYVSMQRYWYALRREALKHAVNIPCVLSEPVYPNAKAGRVRRTVATYGGYHAKVWCKSVRSSKLVHIFDHGFAHLIPALPAGVKSIVTVHDLMPLVYAPELSESQQLRVRKRLECLRLADKLVSVSDYTKRLLMECLNVDEDKISVIPNGGHVEGLRDPIEAMHEQILPLFLQGATILSIGNLDQRKNLEIIPEVLKELASSNLKIRLVRVGAPLGDDLKKKICDVIGVDSLLELGLISDSALKKIYAECDVLFFPSLFEGFGLPVLEAMESGCAVVSSDACSLPEVGGNAVLYFAPQDTAGAADQLKKVISNPPLLDDLRSKGVQRAKQFSWKLHYESLCSEYNDLLGLGSC